MKSLLTLGGGVVLAVSVFLPWYALTLTASGAAQAQQGLDSAAQQFGNSAFQSTANSLGNSFGSLVGRQFGTASAHQALKYISVVLLVLAGIAILMTMARLVATTSHSQPRGALALIGVAAALCIVFRVLVRPAADQDVFAISISWGAWLALASSIAIIVGDLWPGSSTQPEPASPTFSSGQTYPPFPSGQTYPSAPSAPSAPGGQTYPGAPGGLSGPGGLSTPPRPPGWS